MCRGKIEIVAKVRFCVMQCEVEGCKYFDAERQRSQMVLGNRRSPRVHLYKSGLVLDCFDNVVTFFIGSFTEGADQAANYSRH